MNKRFFIALGILATLLSLNSQVLARHNHHPHHKAMAHHSHYRVIHHIPRPIPRMYPMPYYRPTVNMGYYNYGLNYAPHRHLHHFPGFRAGFSISL